MAGNHHRRPRWIAIGDLNPAVTMRNNKQCRRALAIELAVIFLMALSSSSTGIAHSKPGDNKQLLESGQAEKLLSPTSNEIKIVSYNIRWRSGEELQQIIRWLKDTNETPAASIIGLQEVDRAKKRSGNLNHPKALADSLGMYYAWAAPHDPKGKNKEEETGVALLSYYPMSEITRLVLTENGPGRRARVAIGATVKIGDKSIRVYSVHGETRLPMTQKIDQLRVVLDDLAKFPKANAAVVLGDFNIWEEPTFEGLRKLLTNAGFNTPIPDDEPTFATGMVLLDLKLKLDWIWVRGLEPQNYGIDRNLKVSDHFPLWTVVKLPAD